MDFGLNTKPVMKSDFECILYTDYTLSPHQLKTNHAQGKNYLLCHMKLDLGLLKSNFVDGVRFVNLGCNTEFLIIAWH
jgi:hypothetical protein